MHPVRATEWRTIRRWLHVHQDERVLDVGTGHGHFVRRLWKPTRRIVGIDMSARGIRMAKAYNCPPGCDFVRGDATQLPFGDESFHRVYSVCTLEHIGADDLALNEIARVLRPGGQLVLSVDSLSYRGVSRRFRDQCRKRHAVMRYYTRQSLEQRITLSGLHLCRSTYVLGTPIGSVAYKLLSFFRIRRVDFMDPIVYLLTYPFIWLFEEVLGLCFTEEGYLIVAEARKRRDQ